MQMKIRQHTPRSRIQYEKKLALPIKLWKIRSSQVLPDIMEKVTM